MSATAAAVSTPSPIALARFLRSLSQAQLAQKAGVSRETISRLERGESPQLRTAEAVARALGVEVSTLFPLTDEDPARQQGLVTTTAGTGRHDEQYR